MNQIGERTGTVLGRFLLVLIFLAAGFGTMGSFAKTEDLMKGAGMPENLTPFLLVGAIAFEISRRIAGHHRPLDTARHLALDHFPARRHSHLS